MAILAGCISLGQSLPNLEGIATAGGSAEAIYEVIDAVSVLKYVEKIEIKNKSICNFLCLVDLSP